MSTPHLTELLDLTAAVEAANRAQILEHLKLGAREMRADAQLGHLAAHPDVAVDAALKGMTQVEALKLRTIAMRILYVGAREIAEQAYARAWDRARVLVDERTGEADDTLGTLDQPGADIPPGHVFELNPFAEGAVTV